MPRDLTDDKSTLVQLMAWCCLATSHYLSQCWPRSMSPNGVTSSQWVKQGHIQFRWTTMWLFHTLYHDSWCPAIERSWHIIRHTCCDSLLPSDATWPKTSWSTLVQVTVCRLLGDKPIPALMLTYCQLDPKEQKIIWNWKFSIQENAFENVTCKIVTILSLPQCVTIVTVVHVRAWESLTHCGLMMLYVHGEMGCH